MKTPATYIVKLNADTYNLLMGVKEHLGDKLGFAPTNGQVVRHLIESYNRELPSNKG